MGGVFVKLSKKMACLINSILIFLLFLSACSSRPVDKQEVMQEEKQEEKHEEKQEEKPLPITLDLYINYSWWPKARTEWGNDLVSKEITRITGVSFNIDKAANNDESMSRLNMMLSTGEYPDIVMTDDGVIPKRLIQKGMFMPLSDLIDKYGQEIIKNIGLEYLEEYCTETDDEVYVLPNGIVFEAQTPQAGHGVLLLKGLYERMGSPPLDTTEDLYNYLRNVKESGLKTKNGEPYIPVLFDWPTQDLAPSFGVRFFTIDGGSYVYGSDKRLQQVIRVPAMRDIFHFTSKLFREELMDQQWLLQDEGTGLKKMLAGRFSMYFASNAFGIIDEYNDKIENESGDSYILVKTPLSPGLKDVKYNLVTKRPWNRIYITTQCKDPVRAMEFFNWESSETGQYVSRIGPEGVVWNTGPDGKPIVSEKFAEKLSTSRDDALSEIGFLKWCYMQNNKFTENAISALLTPEERIERKARADIILNSMWYAPELEILSIDPSSKTGISNTKLNTYFGKMDRKLYMAQDDISFEQMYNSALPEMEILGLSNVEYELNRQIAENLKNR